MIELDKNFKVEISKNEDGRGQARVKLAFLASEDAVTGLTPQQARALAIDLIKAAHLADANSGAVMAPFAALRRVAWE